MRVLLVSYDLRKPGQNYQPLWDRLAAWGAYRGLLSMWFVESDTVAAEALRDDLSRYVDANDGIFVCELAGRYAWRNLMGNASARLASNSVHA
jgi:hypothetical protein